MLRRFRWPFVLLVVIFPLAHWGRGYPWQLALLAAIAIAALGYSLGRTIEALGGLWNQDSGLEEERQGKPAADEASKIWTPPEK